MRRYLLPTVVALLLLTGGTAGAVGTRLAGAPPGRPAGLPEVTTLPRGVVDEPRSFGFGPGAAAVWPSEAGTPALLVGRLAGAVRSTVEIGGQPATVLTSPDGSIAAVVWVDGEDVTLVAGSLSEDEVLAVARGLR